MNTGNLIIALSLLVCLSSCAQIQNSKNETITALTEEKIIPLLYSPASDGGGNFGANGVLTDKNYTANSESPDKSGFCLFLDTIVRDKEMYYAFFTGNNCGNAKMSSWMEVATFKEVSKETYELQSHKKDLLSGIDGFEVRLDADKFFITTSVSEIIELGGGSIKKVYESDLNFSTLKPTQTKEEGIKFIFPAVTEADKTFTEYVRRMLSTPDNAKFGKAADFSNASGNNKIYAEIEEEQEKDMSCCYISSIKLKRQGGLSVEQVFHQMMQIEMRFEKYDLTKEIQKIEIETVEVDGSCGKGIFDRFELKVVRGKEKIEEGEYKIKKIIESYDTCPGPSTGTTTLEQVDNETILISYEDCPC